MYIRVWEYRVAGRDVEAFLAAYGPDGDWARLFGGSAGYVGTELYRSTVEPDRFITVDRWDLESSWRAFLAGHGDAYAALDVGLEELTQAEHPLVEGST